MLVIYMTVTFFLGWPTILVIFATDIVAFPWPRMCLFVFPAYCISKLNHEIGLEGTNVKSQGLLNTLLQSLHFCKSLITGCADLRLRAIDLNTSSSDSSLTHRFIPCWDPLAT